MLAKNHTLLDRAARALHHGVGDTALVVKVPAASEASQGLLGDPRWAWLRTTDATMSPLGAW